MVVKLQDKLLRLIIIFNLIFNLRHRGQHDSFHLSLLLAARFTGQALLLKPFSLLAEFFCEKSGRGVFKFFRIDFLRILRSLIYGGREHDCIVGSLNGLNHLPEFVDGQSERFDG